MGLLRRTTITRMTDDAKHALKGLILNKLWLLSMRVVSMWVCVRIHGNKEKTSTNHPDLIQQRSVTLFGCAYASVDSDIGVLTVMTGRLRTPMSTRAARGAMLSTGNQFWYATRIHKAGNSECSRLISMNPRIREVRTPTTIHRFSFEEELPATPIPKPRHSISYLRRLLVGALMETHSCCYSMLSTLRIKVRFCSARHMIAGTLYSPQYGVGAFPW